MTFDFRALKAEKKPEFHRNYRDYYPAESLESVGFTRKVCSKCGRGFWSEVERDYCDEPTCSGGYRFIGEKLTRKRFSYREAWDEYVKTFKKWDYTPIKRYPVVCRWYEDLYFVNAGINDFQPYVVAGEVEPPAPAVLEPQFCLRFQDMDSVGVTGRHYTGFIMVGQHTFNTPDRHVYFKDEGILQMHEFLTEGLGIKSSEIFYHEDVWAGGGNYGPSMEFFSRGLELGNQVYMQYEVLPDGSSRELRTKVIDMGAGLERWSWFSQGNPMSYDSTFPEVMDYIYKSASFKFDESFMARFGYYSGMLDIDEVDDIESVWGDIAADLGLELSELKSKVYEARALYTIADHTRTLLVAIHDGALPSNVGGGYNLRNILRRCWSLNDEYNLQIELEEVFEKHVGEFGRWYTELKDVGSLYDIIAVERERYRETAEKGRKIVGKERDMTVERMVELYDSQGITPDLIHEMTGVDIPDNFYRLVDERHEKMRKEEDRAVLEVPEGISHTVLGYYEDQEIVDFKARVLSVFDDHVILDRTFFYPEGGGQEADNGTIAGRKVKHVQKVGRVVVHDLEDVRGLNPGEEVECRVDDKRRIQLMQHHTATHIVNAAARRVLGPHIFQAGAHKSEKVSRLDITHYKAVEGAELKAIEEEANRIVGESRPVTVSCMRRNDAEERYGMGIYQGGAVPGTELRIVNVEGVDVEACGGTHLKNTEDVGHIKMLSAKRIQDGVVRLEFTAGGASEKAAGKEEEWYRDSISNFTFKIEDRGFDVEMLKAAAAVFSIEPRKLPQAIDRFTKECERDLEAVEKMGGEGIRIEGASDILDASRQLFNAWKTNRKALEKLQGEAGREVAEDIEAKFKDADIVRHITSGLGVKALTELANKAVEKQGRLLIVLNNADEKVNVVVASSSGHNAAEICEKLSRQLGGGGRGRATLAIGGGKSDNAEKTLEEFEIG
ncbi:MAG: alanine--tRNA ligase [Candidatus Altiarchaeales archaeon]|nr:alanine--tRNA ligase [Candidatus Altiarchaeales archaeon]MBD3416637.1 alanine--tRNA ligase [Candidatus Altiarchaeales archaeon]